jgi:hypothetical protein
MTRFLRKRMWLAGASLLAILVGSGAADAVVFGGPQGVDYVIPKTGYYDFTVAGAQGGNLGGYGAIVGGELFLDAGTTLDLVVGGYGGSGINYAGGGGGGSFVFDGELLFAAGGGGGANFFPYPRAGPGIGNGGHPAGPASYGGSGGDSGAQSGSFPYGGSGGIGPHFGFMGPSGGYGGGGGAGYNLAGAGGGAPGGSSFAAGGYSYAIDSAREPFGITGGNLGVNGYVSINFVAVPEPSTWAMAIAGFGGLSWLARLRAHKPNPA